MYQGIEFLSNHVVNGYVYGGLFSNYIGDGSFAIEWIGIIVPQ